MIEILIKPESQIRICDIESLIALKVPEGKQIEFKINLPGKKQADPWSNGGGHIEDYARNEIFDEVVTFQSTNHI